jgi:hypothetical protein
VRFEGGLVQENETGDQVRVVIGVEEEGRIIVQRVSSDKLEERVASFVVKT